MEGLNLSKLIPWKKLGFLLVGLIILIALISYYGAADIGKTIIGFGGTYIIILLLSFFWFFLQSLAWNTTLGEQDVSFWSLFKIKLSGEGLNMLSPFTLVGGDPVRVDLLKKQGVPAAAGSIVADNAVRSLTILIVIVVGLIIAPWNLGGLFLWVKTGIPVLTAVIILLLLNNWRGSQQGFFSSTITAFQSFQLCKKTCPALRGTLEESDRLLANFYAERRGAFFQALLLHLLGQGLKVAEIYLIGTVIFPEFSLALALLLAALLPIVMTLFSFLPGSLGILEAVFGGIVALALGGPAAAAGVSLVLIRRIRALFWIIVGLALAGNPFGMFMKK